jgi:phage tail sheath protein FI
MPGVNVTTSTRSGPVAQNLATSGQVFMAGLAERGSTSAPVLVRGLADFEAKFGTRQSYSHLYDNIAMFFEEGGAQAYVIRVVGPSATKGFVVVDDRQYVSDDTVQFEAISGGAWSANLTVTVNDLSASTEFIVSLNGAQVERFTATTVAEIVSAFSASAYVVATSLGSNGVAPDDMPAEGVYSLSAGTDDRASVNTASYEAALALFIPALGDGSVCIPGLGSSVHAALIAHAEECNRIALLAMDEDSTPQNLKDQAATLDSEFAGLFAPWIKISTPTGTRFTSPEGYVAACRNRAHSESGPWRAPAGQIAVARYVVGLKADYNRLTGDDLDLNKVNAIRVINNTVRLYGWRSLSDDTENYSLLIGRDTLNMLVIACEEELEEYVFQSIDVKGQLLSKINGTLVGICDNIKQAGGFYPLYDAKGNLLDPGYKVDTGPSVNSISNLANNEVRARVSVRIAPTSALISVTIVKVGLLSAI